jgi:branched-chain amino acid transport system substrate-binding protein
MLLIAVLAVFSLLGAACGGDDGNGGSGVDDGAVEKTDVSVWFQGALSGPYNYLVIPSFQGAQLRVDELNADESFPYNITLERGDTQGSPDNAPTVVEEVVSDPNTVAVIGPQFSGESAASGDTYNDSAIPFVTGAATNVALGEEGWDYWYRAIGNDGGQGGFMGKYIAGQLKPASLFVAHDKSEYGQPLAETVRDTVEEAGVEVAGFEGAESGQEDYSALISAVESSGAEAFFFGGYDADFGKIAKQARDAGLDIPLASADGSLSSTFTDLAGNVSDVHLIAPTNISGDFIQKYNDEVGGDASAVPVYAAEGYDVASLIGEGLLACGEGCSPEEAREAIKGYLDGLAESPYQGVAKEYAFADNHELLALEEAPQDLYYLYEVQNGEISSLGSAAELGL